MSKEHELTVELEQASGRRGEAMAPVRLAPDDLVPETLRAVVESFVLREGTDYGAHEVEFDTKVAQVMAQIHRGEACVTFDPESESVNVVPRRR